MTVPYVEYGEERLARLSFLPGAGVVATRVVPEFLRVSTFGATQVVIGLGAVAGEVARLLQLLVVETNEWRDLIPAAHRLGAIGDRMHAGDPSRSGGGADGAVVEAVEVTKSFVGKFVYVRGLGVLAPIATDPLDAIVLAGDPENVGFLLLS